MYLAPSESSLVSAVSWVEQVLTGSFATACAVLAMAGIGYQLFNGRIDQRRAVQVALGIFVLFSGPALVREMVGALPRDMIAAPGPESSVAAIPPPMQPKPIDPYAGASVPMVN